jgi:general secretion pathway protein G
MRKPGIICRPGFSLTELLITTIVIGILAAIAIPKLSRSSVGAGESALMADLQMMRMAIENYASDHNGTRPTYANLVGALTKYTDAAGNVSSTKTATAIYGPYLAEIPTLRASKKQGGNEIAISSMNNKYSARFGWMYDEATGTIAPNTQTDTDSTGRLYTDY